MVNIIIFFGSFLTLCFFIYTLFKINIKSNNKKIENSVQPYIVKKYANLKGEMISYPFIDSEFNQKCFPAKYDFIFCNFGLIILQKDYKPIMTLYNKEAYNLKIEINKCNLIKHNSYLNRIELHLTGIGHITKIKIIVKLNSKETSEEIYKLINDLVEI